jgi:DNA polymerase-4
MPSLCRDCLAPLPDPAPKRCISCNRTRILSHPELTSLSIAHIDCDAFYASVEKRDDPSLAAKPLIVGGGTRGVVTTCCYIARIFGVRSAMPMYKALALCPDAVVLPPRLPHYAEASRAIRSLMLELTPAVEPLSLDEAFLDLTGTDRLHGMTPAASMTRLAKRIEAEVGVTASVGLSHNKFLAKIASDLDKPRGFSVIGRAETAAFLIGKPVSMLWGVGEATRAALASAGIRKIDDILRLEESELIRRFGATGQRLWHLARGEDTRVITASSAMKSISNESTFENDITDRDTLKRHLWRMAEKVSDRAKALDLQGRTVTLKMRRKDFSILSRQSSLHAPTQLADTIFRTAEGLLGALNERGPFRLIGVGMADLSAADGVDPIGDLLDPSAQRRAQTERATDAIRAKFGPKAITKGRGFQPD